MKAYTDIEQSIQLAKILPIESADMCYKYVLPKSDKIHHVPEIGNPIESLEWYNKGYTMSGKEPIKLNEYCIPCWSLASLLEYLRKIDLFPNIIDSDDCVLMDISFYDYEDGKVLHSIQCLRVEGKTILDTCYAMIIKLHELNFI